MKTRIKVLQKHIDYGTAGSTIFCPIALALRAKGYKNVDVDDLEVRLCVKRSSKRLYANLPRRAKTFIEKYDNGFKVSPIKFDLKLV